MHDDTGKAAVIAAGDPREAELLLPLVYEELRRLAAHRLAQEQPGHTLQPTALVHEAYMRLVVNDGKVTAQKDQWNSRGHFFAAAAEAMRRILIESARRKKRDKHGGDRVREDANELNAIVEPPSDDILALDEALTQLANEDAPAAQVVELHFFGGLAIEDVAEMLGISRATAYRHWAYARAWLRCAIGDDSGGDKTSGIS